MTRAAWHLPGQASVDRLTLPFGAAPQDPLPRRALPP